MSRTRLFLARHVAPTVPPAVLVAVTLAFATLSLLRGLDYATAPKPAGGSLVLLDAFGSIQLWGWLLTGAAVHLFVAYAVRVHIAIWSAHILLGAVYAGMAAAILRAGTLGESWAPIIVPLGGVLWHVGIACLTKPLPPRTLTTTRPGA